MASPAANTDLDAAAVFSAAAVDPLVTEVVGLGGGGDEKTCHQFAAVMGGFLEYYSKGKAFLATLTAWWNLLTDGLALTRFKEAAEGKPMDKVYPEGQDYRSMMFLKDGRADLTLRESDGENYELEVAVMAAKFAYENPAHAMDLVLRKLQGRDFEFFNCPNLVLGEGKTTQAFAFVRKEKGRNVMYVAFRGTDELNDWRANLDCGLIEVSEEFGKVHVGFMKALGLVRTTGSFDERFPRELPRENWPDPPAYHAIRQWLTCELAQLRDEQADDPTARVALKVVGHSLGGALAILFAAMLHYHKATIPEVSSVEVITMGQPRVGDSTFAGYMTRNVIGSSTPTFTYKRMVYSYDLVARVPFDDDPDRTKHSYSIYRHFGVCLCYKGWFKKLQFTDDSHMEFPNVGLGFIQAAYTEKGKEEIRASVLQGVLQEPASAVSGRIMTLFIYQFHFLGEYLNAARHGRKEQIRWSLSSLRGFFRRLLHPTSFCNRSRRRRVVITTVDDDVSY